MNTRTQPISRRRLNLRVTRAQCTSVHQNAAVALPRLNTSDYPEDARAQLARAVTRAREAAGWTRRRDFTDRAGISLRSLVKLEGGEQGVGRRVLEAVGRALPEWTEDTPYDILAGGQAPATSPPDSHEEPAVEPDPTPAPLSDEDRVRLQVLKDTIRAEGLTDELRLELLRYLFESAGGKLTTETLNMWLSDPNRLEALRAVEDRNKTEHVTPGDRS